MTSYNDIILLLVQKKKDSHHVFSYESLSLYKLYLQKNHNYLRMHHIFDIRYL